jgi:AcrR family transcriptional regulator
MTGNVYDVNTPRPYHHGDLRRALIEAALEIVRTEGLEALSLREAARRAGVSAMAPYRHFADKAALITAVRGEILQMFFAPMAEADRAADPWDGLRGMGVAYVDFALDHPALFRLMLGAGPGEAPPAPCDPAAPPQSSFDLLQQRVRSLVPAEAVEVTVLSCWAFVHGLASLALDGQLQGDPRAAARQATAFFVEAVKARTKG